jgi:sugar lactone lactonase YvrE
VVQPRITAVQPPRAVEGGRIAILGAQFPVEGPRLPDVQIGERPARVVCASSSRLDALVPTGLAASGPVSVRVDGAAGDAASVEVAVPCATGLHQVDSPVFDREGNLYVTYSGTRGQQVPVSIFRVRRDGLRETFSSGIVNPTSMAVDADGQIFVSSRFEGVVYRLEPDGAATPFATDLGVACGLAFAPDGSLFVGDRSGTILRVDRHGRAESFASLPTSVAAFHLALGPDAALYVTGPTLSTYDPVYRIGEDGVVAIRSQAFGRPQGLAFDTTGALFVVEALAGASGVYRVGPDGDRTLVVAGPDLIGLAFDAQGDAVVCSSDSAYRFGPLR